jgi:hypothetical protein
MKPIEVRSVLVTLSLSSALAGCSVFAPSPPDAGTDPWGSDPWATTGDDAGTGIGGQDPSGNGADSDAGENGGSDPGAAGGGSNGANPGASGPGSSGSNSGTAGAGAGSGAGNSSGSGSPPGGGPGEGGEGGAGGSGSSGAGGGGEGAGSGTAGGGAAGFDPSADPDGGGFGSDPGDESGGGSDGGKKLPPGATEWLGRWSGSTTYIVATPFPELQTTSIDLLVTTYEIGDSPGFISVEGRMGIGACLLSGNFSGQIFLGNDVSHTAEPIFSLTAVGQGDTAQTSLANIAAKKNGKGQEAIIAGTLNMSSRDPREPCYRSDLKFTLKRPVVANPVGTQPRP